MSDIPAIVDSKSQSRRKFLRRAFRGCLFGGAGALAYAYGVEPHWVEIEQLRMPMVNLPDDLVGLRIVQLSDIHVGANVADHYLIETLNGLVNLKPDLIVLTGDFMTSYQDEQIGHVLNILQHLPETPLGKLAIFGNHDYGRGHSFTQTAQQLSNGLSDLDIKVLRNEVIDIAGLQVAGLDELLYNRCLVELTLNQLDPQRAMLTLCHNPDAVDQPGWNNFQGWILAGHTHGGQCKLPGFNPPITPVWNKRYTSGVFQLAGNRQMYINRGLGYLRRVRFNCRPEVTVFTLEQAETT